MIRTLGVALTLLAVISLTACSKSSLSTDDNQDLLSNGSYYLTASADIRIYYKDAGLGTFISQLVPINGKLTLPKTLQVGAYESRTDSSTPHRLDLIAKVYVPDHPSGDFYFESPVLGPSISVTNVTTALSWYLRNGFSGIPVRITKNTFDNLVLNIELICDSCRKKTNSEVLDFIRSNPNLVDYIRNRVQDDNPALHLNGTTWTTPPPLWAYSDPILSLHGAAAMTVGELSSVSLVALYLDPLNSTQKILPSSWSHTKPSSATTVGGAGTYNYTFNYDDNGTHVVQPIFDSPVPNDNIQVTITVEDANRVPTCSEPIRLDMRARILNTIDLQTFCHDDDLDNASLVFSLQSGPSGLTLSNAGILKWMPQTAGATAQVNFAVVDSKNGMRNSSLTILVTNDNAPTFTTLSSSYNFTEGLESTIVVQAIDLDGDPLELVITPLTSIYSGYPDGAGSLTNITRTGSAGNYTFTIKFTPSYQQVIGTDGTLQLRFVLKYESDNGNFDTSIEHDPHTITYNVTNTDDPPLWDLQPMDQVGTEGVPLGGLLVGHATDPTPNPTALTYSLENATGNIHCGWGSDVTVTADGAGFLFLNGVPPYFAYEECVFVLKASDANNLFSLSTPFKVTTANTNQPIALLASPLTSVSGFEGKTITVPLNEMFVDPDIESSPLDEREYLSYNCMVDTDPVPDGVYESTCVSAGLLFTFSPAALIATIVPPAQSAGVYPIRMTITDVGGATATHDFDLEILEYATAMTLSTSFDLVTTSAIEVNEATAYSLTLTATPASGRAVDNYDFYVNPPTCAVQSGSGACSANLIKAPGNLSGTGPTDFIFTLTPNYADGNNTFPGTSRTYIVSFYAQKTDDATVYMQHTITITVKNTNRAPTAIRVTKGSFGCTGSSDNSDPTEFTVCVDASQDKKTGNSWSKIYTVPMEGIDADTSNDSYSYSFLEALAPGSFTDASWIFKFPSCMNAGTGTITRSYTALVSDGRGGTVTRTIKLKVVKASATTSCL